MLGNASDVSKRVSVTAHLTRVKCFRFRSRIVRRPLRMDTKTDDLRPVKRDVYQGETK